MSSLPLSKCGASREPAVPVGLPVIVPLHRSLAPGTLHSILRQADWTIDDVEEHMK
ncbi:type II toxin-antitoxin system HicA family toxin [Streptomyces sp. NPDC002491]